MATKSPKKTNKKHSQHDTDSLIKKLLTIGAILVLLSAITVQIMFNVYVKVELDRTAIFQTRSYFIDAVDGIDRLKTDLAPSNRIVEARLHFPNTKQSREVRYLFTKGYEEFPDYIEFTTDTIFSVGKNSLDPRSFDTLFASIPLVQACTNPFRIVFELSEDENVLDFQAKKLSDGRIMYLWRNENCGDETAHEGNVTHDLYHEMEDFEDFLLKAESY